MQWDTPDQAGVTPRQKAENQGRIAPQAEVPDAGEYLWDIFWRLNKWRQTGFSAQVTAPADLEAWCRLAQVRLTPWELDTLGEMEQARLEKVDPEAAPTGSEVPMTNSQGIRALMERLSPNHRFRRRERGDLPPPAQEA